MAAAEEIAHTEPEQEVGPTKPVWRRVASGAMCGTLALGIGVIGYQKLNEHEPCAASFNIDSNETSRIDVPDEKVLFGRAVRSGGVLRVAVGRNAFYPNDYVQNIADAPGNSHKPSQVSYEINDTTTLVLQIGTQAVTSSCVFSKS